MGLSLRYTALRSRVRDYVNDRDRLLHAFRLLRCALIQGPWQPWLVRHYQAHGRNAPLPVRAHSIVDGIDVPRAVDLLNRDAYTPEFRAPAPLVDEIVEYARADGAKRIDNPHLRCDAVERIAYDPQIVDVARGFLKTEPILLETKIFWTIPRPDSQGRVNAAAEQGLFHYDLADIKSLAVFVYLSDVDADSGPHVVIRGSQGRTTLGQILGRSLDDDIAQRRFGERIHVITGRRGTGWFEDITCYHKQAHGEKVRLMLSILYSLHRKPRASDSGKPVGGPEPAVN